MCRTLASLDYAPILADGALPAMVTLTYPGDWEIVAPDGRAVKRHFVLRKRFERRFSVRASWVWKLEFQRRGAPHLHVWLAVPNSDVNVLRSWLAAVWADVVAHSDLEERRRHESAETAVDVLAGFAGVRSEAARDLFH